MALDFEESNLLEFAKTVELTATTVLEGLHDSRRGGEGIEFHSALPYSDGEDARRIDWKRFAASDRYYINRFQRDEKTSWAVAVDSSKSMNYAAKARWAHVWAGALLFLAKSWGDSWRLLPQTEFSLEEAFENLSRENSELVEPSSLKIESRKGERLVVLSDFFWADQELESLKKYWIDHFDRVYLLQILSPQETHFDFSGVVEFRDMESNDKLILDSKSVSHKYRKALKMHQEFLSQDLPENSFAMTFLAGKDKIENQLLKFFEAM